MSMHLQEANVRRAEMSCDHCKDCNPLVYGDLLLSVCAYGAGLELFVIKCIVQHYFFLSFLFLFAKLSNIFMINILFQVQ